MCYLSPRLEAKSKRQDHSSMIHGKAVSVIAHNRGESAQREEREREKRVKYYENIEVLYRKNKEILKPEPCPLDRDGGAQVGDGTEQ